MDNYRYVLRRSWNANLRGLVNFIMLNPSTADDVFDDPTIRRCIGFAKRWGFSGLVVTNLFAYRATHPADLYKAAVRSMDLAIGADNYHYIGSAAEEAESIVCAWGNRGSLRGRDLQVTSALQIGYDLLCIGRTALGNPLHPVREAYTDKPEPFRPRITIPEMSNAPHPTRSTRTR
jgi:hypothetical protein